MIDAGIPIKSFVGSTTIAIKDTSSMDVEDESKFILNPSFEELNKASSVAFYAYNSSGNQVSKYYKNKDQTTKSIDTEDILRLNELAKNEVELIINFQKRVIYDQALERSQLNE